MCRAGNGLLLGVSAPAALETLQRSREPCVRLSLPCHVGWICWSQVWTYVECLEDPHIRSLHGGWLLSTCLRTSKAPLDLSFLLV